MDEDLSDIGHLQSSANGNCTMAANDYTVPET